MKKLLGFLLLAGGFLMLKNRSQSGSSPAAVASSPITPMNVNDPGALTFNAPAALQPPVQLTTSSLISPNMNTAVTNNFIQPVPALTITAAAPSPVPSPLTAPAPVVDKRTAINNLMLQHLPNWQNFPWGALDHYSNDPTIPQYAGTMVDLYNLVAQMCGARYYDAKIVVDFIKAG